MCFRGGLTGNGVHHGTVNRPPELHDFRIRLTPCGNQSGKLVLLKPHLQSAHRFQRSHGAAVAESKFCDLAFLPQVAVDAVLFYGDTEHLGRAGAVDILALGEYILPPLLAGKPCDDTGFNRGEVRHNELSVFLRHECCANQLGKGVRHILIEHFQSVKVTCPDKPSGFGQIVQMILREILHLNDATGPPPGAVGSVELEHTSCAVIGADGGLHCLILFNAGFRNLLAQGQYLLQLRRCCLQKLCHSLFAQGIGLHAVVRKPLLHLLY